MLYFFFFEYVHWKRKTYTIDTFVYRNAIFKFLGIISKISRGFLINSFILREQV